MHFSFSHVLAYLIHMSFRQFLVDKIYLSFSWQIYIDAVPSGAFKGYQCSFHITWKKAQFIFSEIMMHCILLSDGLNVSIYQTLASDRAPDLLLMHPFSLCHDSKHEMIHPMTHMHTEFWPMTGTQTTHTYTYNLTGMRQQVQTCRICPKN